MQNIAALAITGAIRGTSKKKLRISSKTTLVKKIVLVFKNIKRSISGLSFQSTS